MSGEGVMTSPNDYQPLNSRDVVSHLSGISILISSGYATGPFSPTASKTIVQFFRFDHM